MHNPVLNSTAAFQKEQQKTQKIENKVKSRNFSSKDDPLHLSALSGVDIRTNQNEVNVQCLWDG